jgi:hypothetical protein
VKVVQERRKKLPKSVLDDQFFSLAEMNAFLDVQDKVEEEKQRTGRNLGQFDMAEEVLYINLYTKDGCGFLEIFHIFF